MGVVGYIFKRKGAKVTSGYSHTTSRPRVRVRSVCYVLPEVDFGLFKDDPAE